MTTPVSYFAQRAPGHVSKRAECPEEKHTWMASYHESHGDKSLEMFGRDESMMGKSLDQYYSPCHRSTSTGPFTIEWWPMIVRRHGLKLDLTHREFLILAGLLHHPGEFVSRARLSRWVWRDQAKQESRSLDVHMVHLRRKLGPGTWIQTAKGLGYRWCTELQNA